MRKDPFLITAIITAFLFCFTAVKADHLDGLWRNDRQNITIRIEQDENSIRTKRTDQGIWYTYTQQDANTFTDNKGNRYEVINDDQIAWIEFTSRKRISFERADSNEDSWDDHSDTDGSYDPRERDDPWNRDHRDRDERDDRDEWDRQGRSIEGRWYAKSTKERLIIESIGSSYRVRSLHGGWEKFNVDRRGRLRSGSGDIIEQINSDKIRLLSNRGRYEQIFVRQGNGHHHDEGGKHNDRDHKKDHGCKHSCG